MHTFGFIKVAFCLFLFFCIKQNLLESWTGDCFLVLQAPGNTHCGVQRFSDPKSAGLISGMFRPKWMRRRDAVRQITWRWTLCFSIPGKELFPVRILSWQNSIKRQLIMTEAKWLLPEFRNRNVSRFKRHSRSGESEVPYSVNKLAGFPGTRWRYFRADAVRNTD